MKQKLRSVISLELQNVAVFRHAFVMISSAPDFQTKYIMQLLHYELIWRKKLLGSFL